MSAIVCGKRSFFEDLPTPPVSKKIRCSSSSPVRFSPPRSTSSASSAQLSSRSSVLDHLSIIFPDMDKQLLERALELCGDDLDSAIKSLNELRLGGPTDRNLGADAGTSDVVLEGNVQLQSHGNGEVASSENRSALENVTMEGVDWVEAIVREMMSASNVDDARARASRALEVYEKAIVARVGAEAAQNFHQEKMMIKEQVQVLLQENTILKRAVSIQNERQKEYEDKNHELQNLKQLVSQYQEQMRTLEVNNYALTMHLRQAQQGNSIPGHFHPDVF